MLSFCLLDVSIICDDEKTKSEKIGGIVFGLINLIGPIVSLVELATSCEVGKFFKYALNGIGIISDCNSIYNAKKANDTGELISSICGLIVDVLFLGLDIGEMEEVDSLNINKYLDDMTGHKQKAQKDLIRATKHYMELGDEGLDISDLDFSNWGFLLDCDVTEILY